MHTRDYDNCGLPAFCIPERNPEVPPYEADGDLVCVLLRGDRQINEVKLQRVLDVLNLEPAAEETLKSGYPSWFVGPVDLNVDKIIADLKYL